jgi:hypothetical protein
LLLAAGTDSVALPHDEEGPCASHRGILLSAFSDLHLSLYIAVFGDLGFFVFQPLFHRIAQLFSTGVDPVMSSETQGGLPHVQTPRQGSQACQGNYTYSNAARTMRKKKQKRRGRNHFIAKRSPQRENHTSTAGHTVSAITPTVAKGGEESGSPPQKASRTPPALHSIAVKRG